MRFVGCLSVCTWTNLWGVYQSISVTHLYVRDWCRFLKIGQANISALKITKYWAMTFLLVFNSLQSCLKAITVVLPNDTWDTLGSSVVFLTLPTSQQLKWCKTLLGLLFQCFGEHLELWGLLQTPRRSLSQHSTYLLETLHDQVLGLARSID